MCVTFELCKCLLNPTRCDSLFLQVSFFVLSTEQYHPHILQLSLFVLIGRLELLHLLCQVVLLCLLPLSELPAPQTGLTVRRREP